MRFARPALLVFCILLLFGSPPYRLAALRNHENDPSPALVPRAPSPQGRGWLEFLHFSCDGGLGETAIADLDVEMFDQFGMIDHFFSQQRD